MPAPVSDLNALIQISDLLPWTLGITREWAVYLAWISAMESVYMCEYLALWMLGMTCLCVRAPVCVYTLTIACVGTFGHKLL